MLLSVLISRQASGRQHTVPDTVQPAVSLSVVVPLYSRTTTPDFLMLIPSKRIGGVFAG